MLRASFLWLLLGVAVGGLMLTDRLVPGEWLRWTLPSHVHAVLVGWLVQFALAVAFWLFPRRRTPERPLGYDERLALAAAGLLNVGVLLRVVAEPVERAGSASALSFAALAASALFQVAAVALFVAQLWPRLAARPPRSRPGEA